MPPPLPTDSAKGFQGARLALAGVMLIAISIAVSLASTSASIRHSNKWSSEWSEASAQANRVKVKEQFLSLRLHAQTQTLLSFASWLAVAGGFVSIAVAVLGKGCFAPWLYWTIIAEALVLFWMCGIHTLFAVGLSTIVALRESQFSYHRNR